MMQCLWDTDVLSEYLKGKNPAIGQRVVACLAITTGNVTHFSHIPGLTVEDWSKP